jgi:dipeptidase
MMPNKKMMRLALLLFMASLAEGCTDFLITPGASSDSSAMIAYNADAGNLFGILYHYPPTEGRAQELRPIYSWDTGEYLGTIAEANYTYNVVGNVNEFGLCIGESTFGGVEILSRQDGAALDYGSLIWITLQRSKTAREAIHTMVELMDEYGYASEGESFSIADAAGEVWYMEVIGRGNDYGKLGAVWVARRVPDGYVSAHANHARIQTFPRNDPDNCLYAEDVVDVATFYGLFDKDQDPETFSFSDVYAPLSFNKARLSEARVWSIFSAVADDTGDFQHKYLDYASGRNLTHRMPLWIKPCKKLSLLDVMDAMNSHYEGTQLDSSLDVGAGLYSAPYRPRPLEWKFQDQMYHNERTIGVQQTGWNFVAQIRTDMPPELSAIIWFAVDDSSTSPRVPFYASSRRLPVAYYGKGAQDGVMEPILEFDMSKAFWIQNMVANFAYTRWSDVYPVLRNKIDDIHKGFVDHIKKVDEDALELYFSEGIEASIELVTQHGVSAGDKMQADWIQFYGELFARFRDFFTIVPNSDNLDCGCEIVAGGIPETWKNRIIEETGDHYKMIDTDATERKKIPDASKYHPDEVVPASHSKSTSEPETDDAINLAPAITETDTTKRRNLRDPFYSDVLSLVIGF